MTEQQAIYTEQEFLPEYKNNPLIEALPPILEDSGKVIDMLSHNDGHHDGERQLSSQHRMHCVLRLFRYFQPLEQHIDIEQRFSLCIRQGYLHRSPLSPDYAMALADGHKVIKSGSYILPIEYNPTGSGFTIIGLSGIGKTSAVTRVLNLYPQVIVHSRYHDTPLILKQIVWLKLECPHDGLVKGLCMEFFGAVDRAAGTNYFEMYAKRASTIDILMLRMEQIARLHCVGVLVIDEIQHLTLAKGGGSEKMLNFLVTLVNKIGIPVVLIGTTLAMEVLQSKFRQARRSSGHQGDLLWDRMKNDTSWDIFVSTMWKNQWTRQIVLINDEFKNALYYESQGIADIAVKLYAMAQIRAIGLQTDIITPDDFHIVASEKLGLVKPALDALRSGDKKRIAAIGDIAPISIEDYYMAYLSMLPPATESVPEKRTEITLSEQVVLKLLEMGIEPTQAKRLVGKAMAGNTGKKTLAGLILKAVTLYASESENTKQDSDDGGAPNDVREASGYDGMKAAGLVGKPL
ncbi:MAG: ATP-binding protein [Clostridiales bacterium]|jgi:hypothetical protein|nr:ATP-binding protein [Clostridiales bacterium]